MILGIGTDLANIERIAGTLERFGDRFRNRVFTETEQRKAERRADTPGTYAKRWAAKLRIMNNPKLNGRTWGICFDKFCDHNCCHNKRMELLGQPIEITS